MAVYNPRAGVGNAGYGSSPNVGAYAGNYGQLAHGAVEKIDPRNFGKGSRMMIDQFLTPQGKMQDPAALAAGNPWLALAQKQQGMQRLASRDAANSAAPMTGIEGLRASMAGIPKEAIGNIGARADVGAQGVAQLQGDLSRGSQLENIAFTMATKKKAGEEMAKEYAKAQRENEESANKGFFQKLLGQ